MCTCIFTDVHFPPCLVDAVSNVTMARQGFPRMAIGACFGGPLMSILPSMSCSQNVITACYFNAYYAITCDLFVAY